VFLSFFFFQAEDGIRDRNVTGVQTCALPILLAVGALVWGVGPAEVLAHLQHLVGLGGDRSFAVRLRLPRVAMSVAVGVGFGLARSEERRVGEGRRSRCEEWEYMNPHAHS